MARSSGRARSPGAACGIRRQQVLLGRVDRADPRLGRRRPRPAARPAGRARRHPALGAAAGPAPPVHRRHRDPAAAGRVPETDTDFVPCFTSVQRLTRWADDVEADARSGGVPTEPRFGGSGRQWQRAGDARVVPHVVVPAAGLARRLPAGLGLALNPDGAPGLPLYPESVSYLARLDQRARGRDRRRPPTDRAARPAQRGPGPAAAAALRALPPSRAWLTVPGRGEGLVISVALDDPASEPARRAVIGALHHRRRGGPAARPLPRRRHLPRRARRRTGRSPQWGGRRRAGPGRHRRVDGAQHPPLLHQGLGAAAIRGDRGTAVSR